MPEADLIALFILPFERARIEYMVTGSVAAIVYGEPRLTHDIDLVVHLKPQDIPGLTPAFPDSDFYLPPPEAILIEMRRESRAHFNIIHHETGFKADCYLLGQDPLHRWGMQRRRRVEISKTLSLWLAPPEYVIARKLEFYREGGSQKHLDDIARMLPNCGAGLDLPFLQEAVKRLDLQAVWERLMKDNLKTLT